MSGPLVTVLIDTYNYGQYVEDAVDSVLAQEFPREQLEIVVVDDGSTDDTPQRLEKYGTSIRYLRKPNGGQASAFNFGFTQSRGEIIALLDADDVWLPEKLRRIRETFEGNPAAGMVYHRAHLWDGAAKLSEDTYFVAMSGRVTESRADLLKYAMVATSCLAFRREALAKLMPMPESLRTQADAFLTALIIFTAPIVAIPEFLTKYRIHGANLFHMNGTGDTSSRIEHRMKMRAALLAEIRDWLARNGEDPDAPNLQAYLKQWVKAQEVDEFALRSPGRWRYARHLFEYPRIYGENMTFRHRLFSYLQAVGALFLGYHHVHLVEDARMSYKRWFSRRV
ncbi:MAG TPA: glycosyltransferase [Candidatus Saccharimonadales bacterium]|nr:glycosyltransferase [Candidatus Saccharimonadales bacterium]